MAFISHKGQMKITYLTGASELLQNWGAAQKLGGQNIKNYLIFGIFELKFQGK